MDSATAKALEGAARDLDQAVRRLREHRQAAPGSDGARDALEQAEAAVEAAKRRLDEALRGLRGG